MIKITQKSLDRRIKLHEAWLKGKPEGQPLVLRDVKLHGLDMSNHMLRSAVFDTCNIQRVCFDKSNMGGVHFGHSVLQAVTFKRCDIYNTLFSYTQLSRVDFTFARLGHNVFQICGFDDCKFRRANLNLQSFGSAMFGSSNFDTATYDRLVKRTAIVPATGSFIGWKKCLNGVLVKLQIPAKAQRSNATGRKCRAEYAEVLRVIGAKTGLSTFDDITQYRAGETVRCHKWNPNRFNECSGGIHFFLTRKEAADYQL